MEFKNIQRNHPVYLLDKQTVEVKEGKVVDNQPHINTGIATISSSGQPMRDVTIEVEGKQTIYTIPEHLGVTFAGETVLATDKADLLPEVGKLVNEADEIIKAYEPSKERKAKGEELLAALNPAIKEKQETEKRFKALEGDISGIRGKRADEERRRNEPPLDGRRNPFGDKQRDNLQWRNHRGYSLFG